MTRSGEKNLTKYLWSLLLVVPIVSNAFAETVTVSWDENTESDLSGYNVYIGESSGNYTGVADVGNATEFTWNNLESGKTYFFAVTAYDFSGNESDFSDEVNATLENNDGNPPELVVVNVLGETQLDVVFSEPVTQSTAEIAVNYSISDGVQVLGAVLDGNLTTVHLITTSHQRGRTYTLSVRDIADLDGNPIPSGSSKTYQIPDSDGDTTPPLLTSVSVIDVTHLDVTFSEPVDENSAEINSNYDINKGIGIIQAKLTSNPSVVRLTTTEHQGGVNYTLTVEKVLDLSSNEIAANSSRDYVVSDDNQDNDPPQLISVDVNGVTQIDINFSEALEQASAENEGNYAINKNVQVIGAILDANTTTVHLITSAHQSGENYRLTVNNIKDLAESPNTIQSNTQVSYAMDDNDDFNGDGRDNGIQTPQTFALFQNYPNPFNPETEIRFYLEKRRRVELKIYNPLGQTVRSLVRDEMPSGFHTIVWDGKNDDSLQVPSGVYIYSLEVKSDVANADGLVDVSLERRVKRMTLVR